MLHWDYRKQKKSIIGHVWRQMVTNESYFGAAGKKWMSWNTHYTLDFVVEKWKHIIFLTRFQLFPKGERSFIKNGAAWINSDCNLCTAKNQPLPSCHLHYGIKLPQPSASLGDESQCQYLENQQLLQEQQCSPFDLLHTA